MESTAFAEEVVKEAENIWGAYQVPIPHATFWGHPGRHNAAWG